MSHSPGGRESEIRARPGEAAFRPQTSHDVLVWPKGRGAQGSSIRALIPSSSPNHFSKAPPPKAIKLGFRVSACEFGEDSDIQTIQSTS